MAADHDDGDDDDWRSGDHEGHWSSAGLSCKRRLVCEVTSTDSPVAMPGLER